MLFAAEEGLETLATVHDRLLVQAPADGVEDTIRRIRSVMELASREVLGDGPIPVRVAGFAGRAPLEGPDARFFDEVVGLIRQLEPGQSDVLGRRSV